MLTVTAPYIALFSVYAIVLGAMVSIKRARTGISILHGDDMGLAETIRRHGNFAETVPLALLLIAAAELYGAPAAWIHAACIVLLAARLVHPFGIKHDNTQELARAVGSGGTTLAMLIAVVAIFWRFATA